MASQEIHMLRFGPAEHPHAHNTCAPVSRPAQSLAYESPAVPYRVEGVAGYAPSRSGKKNPVVPAPEPGPRHATERHLQTKKPRRPGPRAGTSIRNRAPSTNEKPRRPGRAPRDPGPRHKTEHYRRPHRSANELRRSALRRRRDTRNNLTTWKTETNIKPTSTPLRLRTRG